MKTGDLVRVIKMDIVANPEVLTAMASDFIPGEDNGAVSIPVDYTVEGRLISDICVGKTIDILRFRRNGVEALGQMTTSPIVKLIPNGKNMIAHTRNSIYWICILDNIRGSNEIN